MAAGRRQPGGVSRGRFTRNGATMADRCDRGSGKGAAGSALGAFLEVGQLANHFVSDLGPRGQEVLPLGPGSERWVMRDPAHVDRIGVQCSQSLRGKVLAVRAWTENPSASRPRRSVAASRLSSSTTRILTTTACHTKPEARLKRRFRSLRVSSRFSSARCRQRTEPPARSNTKGPFPMTTTSRLKRAGIVTVAGLGLFAGAAGIASAATGASPAPATAPTAVVTPMPATAPSAAVPPTADTNAAEGPEANEATEAPEANETSDTNEADEVGGVDCENGIDKATGAECDGGPAANQDNDPNEPAGTEDANG